MGPNHNRAHAVQVLYLGHGRMCTKTLPHACAAMPKPVLLIQPACVVQETKSTKAMLEER